MYLVIKQVHIASVVLSISLFALRGGLVLSGRPLRHWTLRILPHVVDTVLLASAIALAWMLHQVPLVDAWLTAKVLGLIVYVALGTLALKRATTPTGRTAAFLAALLTFAYIVGVALTKSPWSWLTLG